MSTQVFTTTGTWTAPPNVNKVQAECWGAGGAGGGAASGVGGNSKGGGGGGGSYAKKNIITVVPGNTYTVTVGVGGLHNNTNPLNGNPGSDTWFDTNSIVLAKAGLGGQGEASGGNGTGGAGGSSGSSIGDTTTSGSNGGNASTQSGTGGASPNGGSTAAGVGSGNGDFTGNNGNAPGGGASGAYAVHGPSGGGASAGNGSRGQITLTYFENKRYWVGGTGNWDASTTTNWSYTSGGAGGATVPTSVENVFFDANSGSGTVTLTANSACINIDFTGYTGTFAGSSTLNISGSLILSSVMTLTYTGAITLSSTTSGQTVTNSGITLLSALVFNGVGGVWTLQDNMTVVSITLTHGTLIAGSNTISLSGTGTVWSATSGLFTAGTSIIKLIDASGTAKTFSGNGLTYYNFYITGSGSGAYTIVGSNTFNDFKCDTPPHTINFTAGTTQTLQTFTVNGTAGNLMTLQSTSSGTPWHLFKSTAGIVSCDYLSLKDSHVSSI